MVTARADPAHHRPESALLRHGLLPGSRGERGPVRLPEPGAGRRRVQVRTGAPQSGVPAVVRGHAAFEAERAPDALPRPARQEPENLVPGDRLYCAVGPLPHPGQRAHAVVRHRGRARRLPDRVRSACRTAREPGGRSQGGQGAAGATRCGQHRAGRRRAAVARPHRGHGQLRARAQRSVAAARARPGVHGRRPHGLCGRRDSHSAVGCDRDHASGQDQGPDQGPGRAQGQVPSDRGRRAHPRLEAGRPAGRHDRACGSAGPDRPLRDGRQGLRRAAEQGRRPPHPGHARLRGPDRGRDRRRRQRRVRTGTRQRSRQRRGVE